MQLSNAWLIWTIAMMIVYTIRQTWYQDPGCDRWYCSALHKRTCRRSYHYTRLCCSPGVRHQAQESQICTVDRTAVVESLWDKVMHNELEFSEAHRVGAGLAVLPDIRSPI